MIALMVLVVYALPQEWKFSHITGNQRIDTGNRWYAYIMVVMGILGGLIIGLSTDYYTSHSYRPVREMARACTSGAAINIIYGLSLGYMSTIIPIFIIGLIILVGLILLGMFGIALAAIGMLATLPISLAIDAYGPICDNAGGISEMIELGETVRRRTDALDAAGNTTAAIGKGFAIGSAALVGVALYGAFLTRAREGSENRIVDISITNPWILAMILVGAMLPYVFSALTMKSVGHAAQDMVKEVRRQFQDPRVRNGEVEPDYKRCI